MRLAEAPAFNGRVLAGCSPAGFSEVPLAGPIRAETCCMARVRGRVVCRAFIYHDQHGISVHFQIK